jgi:hypothetical protein
MIGGRQILYDWGFVFHLFPRGPLAFLIRTTIHDATIHMRLPLEELQDLQTPRKFSLTVCPPLLTGTM